MLLCASVTSIWCMWFDYQLIVENTINEPNICTIDPNYPHANYPLQQRMSYNASQNDANNRNGQIHPTHQLNHASHGQSSLEALDTFGDNVRYPINFYLQYCCHIFLVLHFGIH